MAQRTKELASLKVYVLLINAFLEVLDNSKPLNLYDPALTSHLTHTQENNHDSPCNPLDRLQPTGSTQARELDPRSTTVRNLLREAMMKRFYNRYHPRAAYKKKSPPINADRNDFAFSYLLDIQSLFHPALADTRLLRTIIFSFTDATDNEKNRHYNSVTNYIWRVVTRYVQQVAYEKLTCEEINDEESVHEIVPQSAHKRAKYDDPTLALLETMVEMSRNPSSRLREEAFTPQEVAAKELHYYQNIDRSEWPKFDEILTWWRSVKIQQNLPCLSQVAQAFLGCLPSSGGLLVRSKVQRVHAYITCRFYKFGFSLHEGCA